MPFDAPIMPELSPVARVLIAARELLADPQHWTKGARRRFDPAIGAFRLCAVGAVDTAAMNMVCLDTYMSPLNLALNRLRAVIWSTYEDKLSCPSSIVSLNDAATTTHAMIMSLFDQAIIAEISETQSAHTSIA